MRFCEQCFNGDRQLDCSLKEQLLSTDDFLVFKEMMIKRRSDLHRSIPLSTTAKFSEETDFSVMSEEVHSSPTCLGTAPPPEGVISEEVRSFMSEDFSVYGTSTGGPRPTTTCEDDEQKADDVGRQMEHGQSNEAVCRHDLPVISQPAPVNSRAKTLLEQPQAFPMDATEVKPIR